MDIILPPHLQRAYNYLSDLRRTNTPKEEQLCLALEWYAALSAYGTQATIANWYDYINEYQESLEAIAAVKNAAFISDILSQAGSVDEIQSLPSKLFEANKKELEKEMLYLLEEEVADMRIEELEDEIEEEDGDTE